MNKISISLAFHFWLVLFKMGNLLNLPSEVLSVWSALGPVNTEGVLPEPILQSKSSLLLWVQPHLPADPSVQLPSSKSHSPDG